MALSGKGLFAFLFQLALRARKTGFPDAQFAFKLPGTLAAALQQLDRFSLEFVRVRSSGLCHLSPSERSIHVAYLFVHFCGGKSACVRITARRMDPTGSAHQALPAAGLRGLSPAGYPPRRCLELVSDAVQLRYLAVLVSMHSRTYSRL